jgi:P-type conjugative transfer protein TrbL
MNIAVHLTRRAGAGFALASLTAVIICYTSGAEAALDPVNAAGQGILDQVSAAFLGAALNWEAAIRPTVRWMFWTLVLIVMVIKFGFLALQKADVGDFFATFVRFTITTGFFWWLTENGTAIAGDIITSMMRLGGNASGIPFPTPSGIVQVGFDILDKANTFLRANPLNGILPFIVSLVILVIIASIAITVLRTLITATMIIYGGSFFLGFGGAEWTSDIVISYFKRIINVGVQIFVLALLIGVGNGMLNAFYAQVSAGLEMRELGVILVFCYCLWDLTAKLPPMIASLVGDHSGSVGVTPGQMAGSASSAASGAASAVAGAAGGAAAVMAAVSQGSANTAAGNDVVGKLADAIGSTAAAGGSMSDDFGGGGQGSGKGSSGDRPSLGEQMGQGAQSSAPSGGSSKAAATGFGGGGGSGSGQSSGGGGRGGSSNGGGGAKGGQGQGSGGGAGAGRSMAAQIAAGQQGAGRTQGGGGTAPRGVSVGDVAARAVGGVLGAAATVGRVGVDAAANLAAGAWAATVAGTAGGRVAATIRARGTSGGAGEPAFDGDSLGAGGGFVPPDVSRGFSVEDMSKTPFDSSEVEAFVNRKAA